MATVGSQQLETLKAELEMLRRENERLSTLAYRDPLTGLRNRRCFVERLAEEMRRNRRRRAPLSIICLDVNGFKRVNDSRGHLAGDAALVAVGRFLEVLTRAEDVCCRLGGDEFAILLPDTDGVQCAVVARRIRARMHELSEHGLLEGLSIGTATLRAGDDEARFLSRADDELYADKRAPPQQRRTRASGVARCARAA